MRKTTQYDIENAIYKIYGYFINQRDRGEERFEKAKKELIENLKYDIDVVESITFEVFTEKIR